MYVCHSTKLMLYATNSESVSELFEFNFCQQHRVTSGQNIESVNVFLVKEQKIDVLD